MFALICIKLNTLVKNMTINQCAPDCGLGRPGEGYILVNFGIRYWDDDEKTGGRDCSSKEEEMSNDDRTTPIDN